MQYQINEIYLKEAYRIHDEWSKLIEYSKNLENDLKKLTIEIEDIYKSHLLVLESSAKDKNIELLKIQLDDMLDDMNVKAQKMDQILKPVKTEIEQKMKDADILWEIISQKYSNLNLQQIRENIWKYINAQKNSIKT